MLYSDNAAPAWNSGSVSKHSISITFSSVQYHSSLRSDKSLITPVAVVAALSASNKSNSLSASNRVADESHGVLWRYVLM